MSIFHFTYAYNNWEMENTFNIFILSFYPVKGTKKVFSMNTCKIKENRC